MDQEEENEKLKVRNAEWRIENGKWEMGKGKGKWNKNGKSRKWEMANGEWEIRNGERWATKGGFRRKKLSTGEIFIRYVLRNPYRYLDALYAGSSRSKTVVVLQVWYIVEYIISDWAFYKDTKKLNWFQKLYSSCNTVMRVLWSEV